MNYSITIAIPTYNRYIQVLSLLDYFIINRVQISNKLNFNILISDNSTDNLFYDYYKSSNSLKSIEWIRYHKNEQNLGYDKNIFHLYQTSKSDYVWFFGDDDIPENNFYNYINEAIINHPDLILLPFRQPVSLIIPQYQINPLLKTYNINSEIINLVTKNAKLTSFILKKVNIDYATICHYVDSGWMHLAITFEVLLKSKSKFLITLNQFCARPRSDNDVKSLDWLPTAFLTFQKLKSHPYVLTINKKNVRNIWHSFYLTGIILTCYGSSGAWEVRSVSIDEYITFGKKYPFKSILFKYPRSFFYWFILKMGIATYFTSHFKSISLKSGYED
jgi:hypothetical protein